MKKIVIAGGCFWGIEAYYSRLKGVISTRVGYTDGPSKKPSYRDVCENSGHVEACVVEYDETILPLSKILEHFFRIVDVTQQNYQSHDVGIQYRNGLYYFDEADRPVIEEALKNVQKQLTKPVVTIVKKAGEFFDAEDYHQQYLDKNPMGYCHINLHLIRPEERKK